MRQIDSRIIDRGTGTEIAIYITDEGFVVPVEGAINKTIYEGSDWVLAFNAYGHPFADARVPSPWDREPHAVAVADEQGVEVPV